MIRVLVVDDSAFMRRLITDLLESTGQIKVVGIARNGADAVAKNLRLQPDVITLDVEMPVMDGLTALTELRKTRPVPVVMLSSYTQSGASVTLEALAKGAVDFIGKPESPEQIQDPRLRQSIIETVLQAATVELEKLNPVPQRSPMPSIAPHKHGQVRLVAIGTSTGGPRALQEVISRLPVDGRTAYLVVQHMPKGFTRTLAERLDSLAVLRVQEAADGLIEADNVYIAPGDYHMTVRLAGGKPHVHLQQTEPVNGHRPSVDVLFSSLSELPGLCAVAVVLTGMGSDGAQGMAALKLSGTYTIAEDASTAVIFGMPKAAIRTGAVDRVVPLPEVAEAVLSGLARGRES